jgi:hypothetical protein
VVGVKCGTAEKDGQDTGELAGLGPKGVLATQDPATVRALEADCVVFMPKDLLTDPSLPDSPSEAWVTDLTGLLESGKNVITPICPGVQARINWARRFISRTSLRVHGATTTNMSVRMFSFDGYDDGLPASPRSSLSAPRSSAARGRRTQTERAAESSKRLLLAAPS